MSPGRSVPIHFRDAAVIVVFCCVPVLVLVHGLAASGTWDDSIDAWLGRYESPFMVGSYVNPWLDFLPALCGLVACYVIVSWLGLGVAKYAKPGSRFFRLRLIIGLALTLLGSVFFLLSTFYASLSYSFFGDYIFPFPYFSPGLSCVLSLIVLSVNAYRVVRAARIGAG